MTKNLVRKTPLLLLESERGKSLKKIVGIVLSGAVFFFGGWALLQFLNSGGISGPELKVSLSRNVFGGTALSVTNADKSSIEIKDIVINDRPECTYADTNINKQKSRMSKVDGVLKRKKYPQGDPVDPVPFISYDQTSWLSSGEVDDNDRRQAWLRGVTVAQGLKPAPNGKYNLCSYVCTGKYDFSHEQYGWDGRRYSGEVSPCYAVDEVCKNVSFSAGKIILNVGDVMGWGVNRACQQVIRARIVTDRGANEYRF